MKLKQKQYNYPSRTIYELSWDDIVNKDEIQDWCEKNFGMGGYNEETKTTRWVNSIQTGNSLMFLLEEDMILFKLRWE